MSITLQTDEKGVLHVPAELLPGSAPRAMYNIQRQDEALIVAKTKNPQVVNSTLPTPQERVAAFHNWVAGLPAGPGLSDEAVSRDSIYE